MLKFWVAACTVICPPSLDVALRPMRIRSYQSSLPLFLPAQKTYTQSDLSLALSIMTAALPVITSSTLASTSRGPPRAVLSLGPFGAQVQPGQEYAGLYPAPLRGSPYPI